MCKGLVAFVGLIFGAFKVVEGIFLNLVFF